MIYKENIIQFCTFFFLRTPTIYRERAFHVKAALKSLKKRSFDLEDPQRHHAHMSNCEVHNIQNVSYSVALCQTLLWPLCEIKTDFRSKIRFPTLSGVFIGFWWNKAAARMLSWYYCGIIMWKAVQHKMMCYFWEKATVQRYQFFFHCFPAYPCSSFIIKCNKKKIVWIAVCAGRYSSISKECHCFSEFLNIFFFFLPWT